MIVIYFEMRGNSLREKLFNSKWLNVNKDKAYNK
jgi:hypothetical protein